LKHRVGVIKAPPRSGKTLLSLELISRVGCKAIIIATQKEWLLQFQETLIGSSTSPAMFDLKPEQVKVCKKLADFRDTDICLATPQQFMSPGGKILLKKIRSLFAVVVTDEVHMTPAAQTSIVLAQFNSTYRIGLSGTPERKQEGLYRIVEDLFGPVIYEAQVARLRPLVEVLHTGIKIDEPSRSQAGFTYFVGRLEGNKKRLVLIAKEALRRAAEGHTVMIPLQRVAIVKALTKLINEEHGERDQIAVIFDGTLKKEARKKALDQIKLGQRRIVVGNARLLSTGLNIPRLSCLLEVTCSSNRPQAIQRTARILTPLEGKPDPLVVYFLDNCKMMRATRRNEWFNAVMPEFKPKLPRETFQELLDWFSSKEDSSISKRRLNSGL
jgi:superfamily II DNA or RNA helicase